MKIKKLTEDSTKMLLQNLKDNFIYNKINNNFYIIPTSHTNFPFLDIYESIRS